MRLFKKRAPAALKPGTIVRVNHEGVNQFGYVVSITSPGEEPPCYYPTAYSRGLAGWLAAHMLVKTGRKPGEPMRVWDALIDEGWLPPEEADRGRLLGHREALEALDGILNVKTPPGTRLAILGHLGEALRER